MSNARRPGLSAAVSCKPQAVGREPSADISSSTILARLRANAPSSALHPSQPQRDPPDLFVGAGEGSPRCQPLRAGIPHAQPLQRPLTFGRSLTNRRVATSNKSPAEPLNYPELLRCPSSTRPAPGKRHCPLGYHVQDRAGRPRSRRPPGRGKVPAERGQLVTAFPVRIRHGAESARQQGVHIVVNNRQLPTSPMQGLESAEALGTPYNLRMGRDESPANTQPLQSRMPVPQFARLAQELAGRVLCVATLTVHESPYVSVEKLQLRSGPGHEHPLPAKRIQALEQRPVHGMLRPGGQRPASFTVLAGQRHQVLAIGPSRGQGRAEPAALHGAGVSIQDSLLLRRPVRLLHAATAALSSVVSHSRSDCEVRPGLHPAAPCAAQPIPLPAALAGGGADVRVAAGQQSVHVAVEYPVLLR